MPPMGGCAGVGSDAVGPVGESMSESSIPAPSSGAHGNQRRSAPNRPGTSLRSLTPPGPAPAPVKSSELSIGIEVPRVAGAVRLVANVRRQPHDVEELAVGRRVPLRGGLVARSHGYRPGATEEPREHVGRGIEVLLAEEQHACRRRLDHAVAALGVERVREHVDPERRRELTIEPAQRRADPPLRDQEFGERPDGRRFGQRAAAAAAVEERGDGLRDRFAHRRDDGPRRRRRRVPEQVLRLPEMQRAGERQCTPGSRPWRFASRFLTRYLRSACARRSASKRKIWNTRSPVASCTARAIAVLPVLPMLNTTTGGSRRFMRASA